MIPSIPDSLKELRQLLKTGELKLEPQPESQPEIQPESINKRILKLLQTKDLSKADLSGHLGQKAISGQLNKVIRDLLAKGLIEYTIPENRIADCRSTG